VSCGYSHGHTKPTTGTCHIRHISPLIFHSTLILKIQVLNTMINGILSSYDIYG
ncbi:hypothetical protein L9F63_009012, partial [Diploptera punctata]